MAANDARSKGYVLKCDEAKPECRNCLAKGVACPGYARSLRWSTKYEIFTPSQRGDPPQKAATSSASQTPSISVPFMQGTPSMVSSLANGLPKDARMVKSSRPLSVHANANAAVTRSNPSPSRGQEGLDVSSLGDQTVGQDAHASEPGESIAEAIIAAQDLELWQPRVLARGPSAHSSDGSHMQKSNSRLSRALLRNYYRLPVEAPFRPLQDNCTMLIEHYFRDICVLYSSYDSALNPFRVAVGRVWDSSPSIYYAIQSMAAAQLANKFPEMRLTGLEMQRRAYECLQNELRSVYQGETRSERILLAILLLGLSTCWHEEGDLGVSHLQAARALIYPKLVAASAEDSEQQRRQNQFFEESLIYWEMLLGFVSQEPLAHHFKPWESPEGGDRASGFPFIGVYDNTQKFPDRKCLPHPWTGIAPNIQMLFAEVGRLIRYERSASSPDPSSMEEVALDTENKLKWATVLEEALLGADVPPLEQLVDPGDERTSRNDFITLAEAYRCAGLLELYRVFPNILAKRLGNPMDDRPTLHVNLDYFSPRSSEDSVPTDEEEDMRHWLTSLGLHVTSLLETLPPGSGTCCLQPILLVTAGSELRFPDEDADSQLIEHIAIVQSRAFVQSRFQNYAQRLPVKPLARMLELVTEVWQRMDGGDDAFWMDVMEEKGLQTVMG